MNNPNEEGREMGQPVANGMATPMLSKVERYGWKTAEGMGVMRLIDKRELRVDHVYQRDENNEDKILAMARNWSWLACGALIVGHRSGLYYVIDGQNRWAASMKRQDIANLPCVVFEVADVADEARGFLAANTLRKGLSSVDRLKPRKVAGSCTSGWCRDFITSNPRCQRASP